MRFFKSLVFAAAVTVAISVEQPLPARANIREVVNSTPTSSLTAQRCGSSLTFTATVYGDPGQEFNWFISYTMGGVTGGGESDGPAYIPVIGPTGRATITYTIGSVTESGQLTFEAQTWPNQVDYFSQPVEFGCSFLPLIDRPLLLFDTWPTSEIGKADIPHLTDAQIEEVRRVSVALGSAAPQLWFATPGGTFVLYLRNPSVAQVAGTMNGVIGSHCRLAYRLEPGPGQLVSLTPSLSDKCIETAADRAADS